MGCGSVTDSALRCVDRILLIRQGEAFQDQQQRIDFLDDLSVTGRGSTGEGPADEGRTGRLARAGHTANLLAGAGHTIGWLAARRAAGITHGGLGLGGVGTEDKSGLEAPSLGCPLYPGRGVLAMRHWVSS